MVVEKLRADQAKLEIALATVAARPGMVSNKIQPRIELQKASRREPMSCRIFGSLMR